MWLVKLSEVVSVKKNLLLNDVGLLGNVDTIEELSDILVSDSAGLLDVSTSLRDVLNGVTNNGDLVLLVGGDLGGAALVDGDLSDLLLSQEVSDLDNGTVLDEVDVDGEMGVDVSHLVLETSGDTDDHVVDEGLDGSQSSDVLSVTIEDGDLDLLIRDLGEGNVDVREVLLKGTSGAGDGDSSGLDVNGDTLGDIEQNVGLDELHCVGVESAGEAELFQTILSVSEKATLECWEGPIRSTVTLGLTLG